MKRQASYGSWDSPITADQVVAGALKLSDIRVDAGNAYWVESRPSEAGRSVIVVRRPTGETADLTAPPLNARTRAHEYGGAPFAVAGGMVCFANDSDQRLYLQRGQNEPYALTPANGCRYADGIFDFPYARTIWVAEDHSHPNQEPSNSLVSVALAGDQPPRVLASGRDFYASPRLSPNGDRLAWISWSHPNMPWDATDLSVANINSDGSLGEVTLVGGGHGESICQPEWSADGVLYFVSDRGGCWNLHRFYNGGLETVVESSAEFARPPWLFGFSSYDFQARDRIVCAFAKSGLWYMGTIDCARKALQPISCPYTEVSYVRSSGETTLFRGGSPAEPTAIVQLDESGSFTIVKTSARLAIDSQNISTPETIEYPTSKGQTAFANFYRPKNARFAAPANELPPLLVKVHGGPTSCADTTLRLDIQFWTSRGFAVADVNYGGSSGFGTAYRCRLDGQWGIVDVDDCTNAALHLVEKGEVDPGRLAISGGSAGGYTVLCALAFKDVFKAGASFYGIGDLVALAETTHKFESRYTDRLVGQYPQCLELYKQRSPLYFADRITAPVIFFQGLDDKVVPPEQTEAMVQALKERSVPVAYLPFEREGHGFRSGATIKRALEAELYFYSRIFGFKLSNVADEIAIENL